MTAACDINNVNVKAFLKLLRFAENQPRDDDQLYYRLFGGGTFTNTSTHPNTLVTIGRHSSTAAGAYQILYKTWREANQNGIAPDFSPASQDAVAFSKLQTRGALAFVCAGALEDAIKALTLEWVSLPGGSQTRMSLQTARDRFMAYQAEFAR